MATRYARRLAVLALRALILVLAMHVSGAAHAIEDIAGQCTSRVETVQDSDCPPDAGDCPPGCPSCHGHASPALPQRSARVVQVAAPILATAVFAAFDGVGPTSSEVAAPFRPPQHG